MSLNEVFQEAQQLSYKERKELLKLLVDSLDSTEAPSPDFTKEEVRRKEAWGRFLKIAEEYEPIPVRSNQEKN